MMAMLEWILPESVCVDTSRSTQVVPRDHDPEKKEKSLPAEEEVRKRMIERWENEIEEIRALIINSERVLRRQIVAARENIDQCDPALESQFLRELEELERQLIIVKLENIPLRDEIRVLQILIDRASSLEITEVGRVVNLEDGRVKT